MRRSSCGGCGSAQLSTVLDLGSSPLADEFAHTEAEAINLPRWPLGLQRCATCTLIQLSEIVPDASLWGGDYGFYSSASSVVVEHSRRYADWIAGTFPRPLRDGLTVEIACNDGVLLKPLRELGGRVLGIDPAGGPVANALADGLEVLHRGFDRETAAAVVESHGQASLIIANNVVAHVADLMDFLEGLALLLDAGGTIVLEFQYVMDLITGNQFDHVYHEHRQFFSLTSLQAAANSVGLKVLDVMQNTAQGGSLRVQLGHVGFPTHAVRTLLRAEEWLSRSDALGGLQMRADRVRTRLLAILNQARTDGLKVAGYGASAKSTTLFSFCNIGPGLVPYMLDTTPTKIGRFTPGTGIPIVSPTLDSRQPDIHLLTVWNYLPEIMRRERAFTDRGGRWLVPIPAPVLL